jgi:hypothetical protein
MRRRRTTPHENVGISLRPERFQWNTSWYKFWEKLLLLIIILCNSPKLIPFPFTTSCTRKRADFLLIGDSERRYHYSRGFVD